MRKFLSISISIIIGLGISIVALIILTNKSLPQGKPGPKAEELADSMLSAVNQKAWDRLRYVRWTSAQNLDYVWDKMYNLAEICFSDSRVLLNLNTLEGIVWKKGVKITGKSKKKLLDKAWSNWCNDSFWLNPVVKIRDEGVIRKHIALKDGRNALLVTFTEGGVTPGDSYLWILGDQGLPIASRMWVEILPTKGLKATWEDWIELPEGVKISTMHRIGPLKMRLTNVTGGRHHHDLGLEEDPFVDFQG